MKCLRMRMKGNAYPFSDNLQAVNCNQSVTGSGQQIIPGTSVIGVQRSSLFATARPSRYRAIPIEMGRTKQKPRKKVSGKQPKKQLSVEQRKKREEAVRCQHMETQAACCVSGKKGSESPSKR